jgi:RNA polymerase sigma-70 factor (ECF subfamily)
VFTIARNAALDELRRRGRTVSLVGEVPAEEPAYEDEERRVRRDVVRAGLERLDPRQRELILLKFHAQLSNAELAKVLGCSVSNAGTRLCRAVERLREVCDVEA